MKSLTFALVAVWGIGGCHTPSAKPVLDAQQIETLRQRAEASFTSAVFFKPDHAYAEHEDFTMMPLIVSEAPGASFGRYVCGEDHCTIDTGQPTVYAVRTTATLAGADYRQHVFVWLYPPRDEIMMPPAHMLKVTLDTLGYPVLWEVLSTEERYAQVYVARSLEQLAIEQFGPPDDGKLAVEQPGESLRNAVIVRVLDDGPAPMGPMVYVDRDLAITTVLCRCMPAQVVDIERNAYYAIAGRDDIRADWPYPEGGLTDLPRASMLQPPGLAEAQDPSWLDKILCLPQGF